MANCIVQESWNYCKEATVRYTAIRVLSFVLVLVGSAGSQTSAIDIRKLMSADEFQRAGLQKLNEQEIAVLNTWLLKFAVTRTSSGGDDQSFADLEGAIVVADDGQLLGKITTNSIDHNSIINSIGPYGSDISSTSIFNNISKYGSDISRLSPFNDITSSPPRIFKGERFIAYLTTNKVKTPRVDPRALVGWLKSQE
jgi:hypothetical protein